MPREDIQLPHFFNFLQSLRTTWRTREILRWERHYPSLLFLWNVAWWQTLAKCARVQC